MQPLPDIQFSVTRQEAELAIHALAQLPYAQVFNLIAKLQGQAQACISQQEQDKS